MLTLYSHPFSGHSHRVWLMLSVLGLDYRTVDVDLSKREQKSPAYMRLNPWGEVPDEGGIRLESYGHVLKWLERVESLNGFIPMPRTRVPPVLG